MAGQFSDWAPYTGFVQAGLVDGQYANAGFTLLAAGPPRLANIGGAAALAGNSLVSGKANQIVFPIGVVQNFNMSHSRNFSRIFEIGSERSYFIAGRTVGQLGLGRVYYHGSSLLRILYAYYNDILPPTVVPTMFGSTAASDALANPHDVVIPPGYENIYLNLASDLFAQPMGLLMYIRDINQQTLGAIYFEACYLPQHSLGTDSQGVLIQEQVAIQFERAVPVAVTTPLTLLSTLSKPGSGANVTFPGIVNS